MSSASAIFISYRRSDAQDVTGRIHDQLRHRFGQAQVFKDVDSIFYGEDFSQKLKQCVGSCQVLLAVIGPTWLTELQVRSQKPDIDWVRTEIATALQRDIPIIPLLVTKATMPSADSLPDDLKPLAKRNAAQARPDPDFHIDMERLIQRLDMILGKEASPYTTDAMPTELTSEHYAQLADALMSAFRDQESLSLMVKRALHQRLNLITQGATTYETTVDRLIEWAEAQGRLPDLLQGALQRAPQNAKLNAFAQTWR